MIDRAVNAFLAERFLNEFVPRPPEEEDNWYSWNTSNWGTKWDVGNKHDDIDRSDPNTVDLRFDSAWSPPVEAYRRLTELGFDVSASYYESGMAFVGEYTSDGDEDHYEIPQTADEVENVIPPHLDEQWGISEYMRDCEADESWDDEEDEDDENLEIDLGEPSEEDNDSETEEDTK